MSRSGQRTQIPSSFGEALEPAIEMRLVDPGTRDNLLDD